MDPPHGHDSAGRGSLPRERGDGPPPMHGVLHRATPPPRARGWTVQDSARLPEGRASPASAGMDPHRHTRRRAEPSLPRERGDGPDSHHHRRRRTLPPPRARGWTGGRRSLRLRSTASPASAGMDPATDAGDMGLVRLPRERGDGPAVSIFSEAPSWPPPRARGWTVSAATFRASDRASPASAGMDPRQKKADGKRYRLPRERGDGPPMGDRRAPGSEPPPRARGWTHLMRQQPQEPRASPASAGMDPGDPGPAGGSLRLPRERGDGPISGFPSASVSRPPPRARGWTAWHADDQAAAHASPASAGMDRPTTAGGLAVAGLPRERGDGP